MVLRASLWVGLVLLGCGSSHGGGDDARSMRDAEPPPSHEDAGADGGPGQVSEAGSAGGTSDAGHEADTGASGAGAGGGGAAGMDSGASIPCAHANCDPEDATCTVVEGAAVCSCLPGYRDVKGNGELCEDVDECDLAAAPCAPNASCVNTPGNFACVCDRGFHGDGTKACEPNAACTVEQSAQQCGPDANCVSFGEDGHCWCSIGFDGDGATCSEIDECARGFDDCHPLAQCANRPDEYGCSCPDGYIGDGHGGAGCFLPQSRLSEPHIPAISRNCPPFAMGTSTIPELLGVRLQVGAKPAQPTGTLLFYWHGTGSMPTEADGLLPAAMRQDILDGGGIIAAFDGTLDTGGDCSGTHVFARGDFDVADLIAACAVRDHNVDPRRIYVTGCSAGGFQAGCMAIARSSYIAAVATNDGGIIERMTMQAAHAPAVIAMYGMMGPLGIVDTAKTSRALTEELSAFGGFAVECDHGGGHCGAPAELYLAAWRFMKDHPFGVAASPYADGLPAEFPGYCSAQR